MKYIFQGRPLPDNFSLYIHNPSVIDPTLALPGHSALYVLVPVANNRSGIDWDQEKESLRERVLTLIEQKTPLKDIRSHIRAMKIITPKEWENDYNVYLGATFNLAHSIKQMLYFRPHNRFEELDGVYLVGGGTHPGSGLPTIYQSALISSALLVADCKNKTR